MAFLTRLLRKTYEKDYRISPSAGERGITLGGETSSPPEFYAVLHHAISWPSAGHSLCLIPLPGLPTALWFLWHLDAICWSRFLPPVQPLSLLWSLCLSWGTVSTGFYGTADLGASLPWTRGTYGVLSSGITVRLGPCLTLLATQNFLIQGTIFSREGNVPGPPVEQAP